MRQSLRIAAVLASRFGQSHRTEIISGKLVKRAQSSSGALTPGDRHSDVGGRIRDAGQPAAVASGCVPNVHPKAEATVAGSGAISNSFLHRQKARF
jgi:hypothetical protein